jgi:hypothetical protein
MHLRLAADLMFRSWFALAIALGVANVLHDSDTFRLMDVQPSTRVVATEFGVFDECGLSAATRVRWAVGESFGWSVLVPDGQPVAWREELVLPSAPQSWSGSNFVDIKDHGRTAVTAGVDIPFDSTLAHAWRLDAGDPPGDYELRLWIDGNLHQVFHFRVE